jgi:hypothetical protein
MPKAKPQLTKRELAIVAKHGPLIRSFDARRRRALVNARVTSSVIREWAAKGGQTNAAKIKAKQEGQP